MLMPKIHCQLEGGFLELELVENSSPGDKFIENNESLNPDVRQKNCD